MNKRNFMFINLGHWQYNSVVPEDAEAFVYEIINKVNGRQYVGVKTMKSGWESYISSCKPLVSDIKELGKDNFHFIIIKFFNNKDDAYFYEQETLRMNDVLNDTNYYNGNIGGKYYVYDDPERLRKLSKAIKEHRRRLSEEEKWYKGFFHSQEAKNKVSRAQKGVKDGPLSEVTKRKLSEHHKLNGIKPPSWEGKNHSEETRTKLSEIFKGKRRGNFTEESYKLLSEKSKSFWDNLTPEQRQEMIDKRVESRRKNKEFKASLSKEELENTDLLTPTQKDYKVRKKERDLERWHKLTPEQKAEKSRLRTERARLKKQQNKE